MYVSHRSPLHLRTTDTGINFYELMIIIPETSLLHSQNLNLLPSDKCQFSTVLPLPT